MYILVRLLMACVDMLLCELDKIIKEAEKRTSDSLNIYIGYGKYAELMGLRSFSDDVIGSSVEPRKRTYKKIKIKITQDKNQLEVKSKSEYKRMAE